MLRKLKYKNIRKVINAINILKIISCKQVKSNSLTILHIKALY